MQFLHAQDVFSKGELSPTMYARITTSIYYKGVKTAKNILPIPQGGARKSFGTRFINELPQTNYLEIVPIVFEYRDQCIYIIIFYDDSIDIWLEGQLVASLTGTGIDATDMQSIDWTILDNRLRVTSGFQKPRDLVRGPSAGNTISGVDTTNDFITLTTPITDGIILPVQFTTAGSLPTSDPQIKTGRTYFIKSLSVNTAAIYTKATDAYYDINRIDLIAAGSGNTMVPQNAWTFNDVTFKNLPVYDFDGGYDSLTFTPGATSGSTTLTASGNIFTTAYIGGLFFGGGGIARITGYSSPTVVNILVLDDFSSTSAILGSLAVLTEPAWSDARGWPKVCGSFQNRSIFANTESLPNGLWCSVINDYDDFDDSTLDDDQAISWYPTADIGNAITFISPYRTLVVNTEAGVYSTPMQSEFAITPRTFALSLQDNTPAASIQPVITDNQLMILTGRDLNSLVWEFGQSAYVPNLISATSDHLITDPVSMAPFRDVNTAGGRYVFVTNTDGTMAMYQTLLTEEVSGWTWSMLEQTYGNAYYRYAISSVLGRCWFVTEREIATAQTPVAIVGVDTGLNALEAIGSNFSTTTPTAVLFTTGFQLPTTEPQIETGTYYFVIGIDADNFKVYATQEDALADENALTITNAGAAANVIPYTLVSKLFIEELSYDVKTHCAITQSGSGLTSASGLSIFDAQTITVKADGRRFDSNPVINGVEQITILGQSTAVDEIEIGHPIKTILIPMPLSIPMGNNYDTGNLAQAKHIRFINLLFNDTVGGRVNNQNIVLNEAYAANFEAPTGRLGMMRVSVLAGWNRFTQPAFVITHDDPYDFNLLGIFYNIEV